MTHNVCNEIKDSRKDRFRINSQESKPSRRNRVKQHLQTTALAKRIETAATTLALLR